MNKEMNHVEEPEVLEETPSQTANGRSSSKEAMLGMFLFISLILFFLVIVSYVGFALYGGVHDRMSTEEGESIALLPKAEMKQSESIEMAKPMEESKEPLAQESRTQMTTPEPNTKIAIKVLNGGAAKGSASVYADILKGAGYTSVTAGNSAGDYTGVSVYYAQAGTQANAEAVKAALSKKAPNAEVRIGVANSADTGSSAITVIVGK